MKKALALFLMLIMLLSAASALAQGDARELINNCYTTGLPIVKEPITLTIVADINQNYKTALSESEFVKLLAEKTGITIDFIQVEDKDKVNLMVAGGTMPDAFASQLAPNVAQNGASGAYLELTELMNRYAPNFVQFFKDYPNAMKQCVETDGKLYGLPYFSDVWYNHTYTQTFENALWMKKLNLTEAPKTIAELTELLRVFKAAGDINEDGILTEYPMGFCQKDWAAKMTPFLPAFGCVTGDEMYVDNEGKVIYNYATEGFKEFVAWMSDLVAEGLLDPETFTQDYSTFVAKASQSMYGVYTAYSMHNIFGQRPECEGLYEEVALIPPLVGPNGDVGYPYEAVKPYKNAFVVTADCKYPEAMMRMVNYINDWKSEDCPFFCGTIKGTDYKLNADGLWETDTTVNGDGLGIPGFQLPFLDTAERQRNIAPDMWVNWFTPYENAYTEIASRTANNEMPPVSFTEAESKERAALRTDIKAYAETTYTNWILKGGVEAEWDKYVKTLNDMGLARYIEIQQAAVDRYNGK